MTLAVAAFTPYPFIKSLPYGEFPRNGIAFVADTRFSFRGSAAPRDFGLKLAVLTERAGCVYTASNVEHALTAMAHVQEFFDKHPDPRPDFARDAVRKMLNALNGHFRQRGEIPNYAWAIGHLTHSGTVAMMAYGPPAQVLTPPQPNWGYVVGRRQLQPDFEQSIQLVLNESREYGKSYTLRPMEWAMTYAIAFQRAFLDQQPDVTVGGGIQFGLLTPEEGMRIHEISRRREGSGAPWLKSSWAQITRDVTLNGLPSPPTTQP